MLTQIDSPRKNTLVYELDGYVTKEDIDYIEKGIEFTLTAYDSINLMIYINAKGEGFDTLVKEFQVSKKYIDYINKIAYIFNKNHWNFLVSIDNLSTKYKEKYFDIDAIAKAWDWIDEN